MPLRNVILKHENVYLFCIKRTCVDSDKPVSVEDARLAQCKTFVERGGAERRVMTADERFVFKRLFAVVFVYPFYPTRFFPMLVTCFRKLLRCS